MKEIVFLNKNADRWKEFERVISQSKRTENPDLIADLFVQLTDDLSYARTYYPRSRTVSYLNSLTVKAHQLIYKNKREKDNVLLKFWYYDVPALMYENRKYLIISFLIFAVSIFIGVISEAYDDSFSRLILGDRYVNMTIYNIENGDPLAVYKQANEIDMFLGITLNNVWVSFLAVLYGVMFSVGTIYLLFSNGVMVGCFLFFFSKYGLLTDAILVIFIHGTIELWAIVVAGAAGIMMGNSILFPGTYSRFASFGMRGKQAIKMAVGLIPFFIIAGFIEGFITRYTQMPDVLKIIIIAASLVLIVWYFFIYPNQLYNTNLTNQKS